MEDSLSHKQVVTKSLSSYATGFLLSLIFTLFAYYVVIHDLISESYLAIFIILLGITQATIQAIFFLHLGKEPKPRWNMYAFLFMTLVVGVLVGGSLWIMENLKSNVMLQEGVGKN